MKRCPTCGSTFTDDSLRFCLQDGATLVPLSEQPQSFNLAETLRDDSTADRSEPPPTIKFESGAAPTIQSGHAAQTVPPRSHPSTRASSGGDNDKANTKRPHPVTVAVVTAAAVLLLVLTGFGLVYLLRDKADGGANSTAGNNTQAGNVSVANTASSPKGANTNNANTGQANATTQTDAPPRVTATASSTRAPLRDNTYVPANALDGSLLTAWIEGADGPGVGEWIRCDFDREAKLRRIYITPGYFKSSAIWSQNNRLAAATFYFSDGSSRRFTFPDRMQEQRLEVGGVKTRWVRIVIEDTYPGSVDPEDTPISQLTFEWEK